MDRVSRSALLAFLTGELEMVCAVSAPARVFVHHSARYGSHVVRAVVAP
jgi:hypothetical protein